MMETKIRALVMDVDGTLTDGKIYMGSDGEIMKAFDIKDGYAIVHLSHAGITPIIITGRKSAILERRCKELNISEVYQGISRKAEQLHVVLARLQITVAEVAYIGDDLNDLECMKMCGLCACPHDAVDGIRSVVDFVCTKNGGSGAVREFIEYIQNRYI